MFNKKFLFGLPLFLLSFSVYASDPIIQSDFDSDFMYLRLGHQSTYVGRHRIDSAKAVIIDPAGTLKVDTSEYKPKYDLNLIGGSIAVGKSFDSRFRTELELAAIAQIGIDCSDKSEYFNNISGDTKSVFLNKGFSLGVASLNIYYDLESQIGVIPYIGGGIGLTRVNFFSEPTSETITHPFALQFRVGVRMNIDAAKPVYLGYKLMYLFSKRSSENIVSNYIIGGGNPTNALLKSTYILHILDFGFIFST